MENGGDIFSTLVSHLGVTWAIITFVVMILLMKFGSSAMKIAFNHFKKKLLKRKMNLGEHLTFSKLKYFREHRISNVNTTCILRKALYYDIMNERIKCLLDALNSFIKEDIDAYDENIFYLKVKSMLDDAIVQSNRNSIANKVPEFVLNAMNEKIMSVWKFYKDQIKSYCYNKFLYESNSERMHAILDVISVYVECYMNVLEEALAEFNGDIMSLKYNGVKCAKCQVCVHDEYLKQLKKELLDEDAYGGE